MPPPPQVLIADDDSNQIVLLQVAIQRASLPVDSFRFFSGGSALIRHLENMLPSAKPDLVLTDLNMPCVDGFEIINWVRAHPLFANLPIVVMSSSSEPEDQERAMELGCNRFLTKPSNVADLEKILSELYTAFANDLFKPAPDLASS
jgi:CheY-like chemotaxis protein